MSLDTEKLHKLNAKGFETLYSNNAAKWQEMVKNAVDYAKSYGGGQVLKGDIVSVIQNAIKIDTEFEMHLKKRGLQQKYWVVWFSEYVIEKAYPQDEIT